jgi:crotonobetainyl-CoA:carnitine CoA-transferase CaiB-like acyl-CoA transferase
LLAPVLATYTVAELDSLMNEQGIPCGAVLDLHGVFANPQVQAIDAVRTLQHPTAGEIRVVGPPYRLSATPAEIRTPPPTLGQHTDEVMRELGFSEDEIAELRRSQAIG